MRLTFPLPKIWASETLYAHLGTLAAKGLAGWSTDVELHAEFPEREALTAEEESVIAAHVAAYIHDPATLWSKNRGEAYAAEVGSLEQQIDALFKSATFPASSEGAAIQAKRNAIKARYPKK